MPFIGAAIGAGGSVLGGLFNKGAAGKAADAQIRAALIAQETQLTQYLQNREDLAPWREAGKIGLNTLMNKELGVGGGESIDPYVTGEIAKYRQAAEDRFKAADPYFTSASDINRDYWSKVSPYLDRAEAANNRLYGIADRFRDEGRPGETGLPVWFEKAAQNFRGSPDYAWAESEARRRTGQQLAAQGFLGSGGQIRAMGQTAAGLASQNYGNYQKTALDQWRQNISGEAELTNTYRGNELEGGKMTGAWLGDIYNRNMELGKNQMVLGKNQLDLASYANEQYQNYFKRLADITGYGVGATKSTVEAGTHYADAASNLQAAAGNASANAALRQGSALSGATQGVASNLQNYFNNQYAQSQSPHNQGANQGGGYGQGYNTGYNTGYSQPSYDYSSQYGDSYYGGSYYNDPYSGGGYA